MDSEILYLMGGLVGVMVVSMCVFVLYVYKKDNEAMTFYTDKEHELERLNVIIQKLLDRDSK